MGRMPPWTQARARALEEPAATSWVASSWAAAEQPSAAMELERRQVAAAVPSGAEQQGRLRKVAARVGAEQCGAAGSRAGLVVAERGYAPWEARKQRAVWRAASVRARGAPNEKQLPAVPTA